MPTRYVSPDQASIEREFDLVPAEWQFAANFNVAPGEVVPVIRVIEGQPDPVLFSWGFGAQGSSQIAMEMLDLAAGERSLLANGQRCIVPALGFYEWQSKQGGGRKPWYIHVEDQPLFGFAGLWDRESFAIVTVPASPLMAGIDVAEGRMPAILARDAREVWLYGSTVRAAAVLAPYPAERTIAYPVAARVESLNNNDESLIEPLQTDVD